MEGIDRNSDFAPFRSTSSSPDCGYLGKDTGACHGRNYAIRGAKGIPCQLQCGYDEPLTLNIASGQWVHPKKSVVWMGGI